MPKPWPVWIAEYICATFASRIRLRIAGVCVLHAQAHRAGVAEHGQHDRLPAASAVDAVAGGWVGLGGARTHPAAGGPGLLAERGDEGGTAEGDAATAVRGGGGQPPRSRRPGHSSSAPVLVAVVAVSEVIGPLRCDLWPYHPQV